MQGEQGVDIHAVANTRNIQPNRSGAQWRITGTECPCTAKCNQTTALLKLLYFSPSYWIAMHIYISNLRSLFPNNIWVVDAYRAPPRGSAVLFCDGLRISDGHARMTKDRSCNNINDILVNYAWFDPASWSIRQIVDPETLISSASSSVTKPATSVQSPTKKVNYLHCFMCEWDGTISVTWNSTTQDLCSLLPSQISEIAFSAPYISIRSFWL